MIRPSDRRIQFLIHGLIAWLFLSKISFGSFIPGFPREVSFLIFQQGFHPYMNVVCCLLLGFPLITMAKFTSPKNILSPFYTLFIFALVVILSLQTILQMFYVNVSESVFIQTAALASSIFMVWVYGRVIPQLWTIEKFIRVIRNWCGILVLLSLVLFVVNSGVVFKGGRFIGVFKHIPYMVTCSTVAFVFFLLPLTNENKFFRFLVLIASFVAIVLTGTRSSAAAALLSLVLSFVVFEAKTTAQRFQKIAVALGLTMVVLFFGFDLFDYAQGVMTGQKGLMMREAQDGVASRKDEFERGLQMFEDHPWLGQGLVSKFASGSDVDVSNYNAMKDPHNIFVSAGVIGGWPLLCLSAVAVVFILIGSLKALARGTQAQKLIAIYAASHLPILIIYHVHLSLGGMADRMYWLSFGFLAIIAQRVKASQDTSQSNL